MSNIPDSYAIRVIGSPELFYEPGGPRAIWNVHSWQLDSIAAARGMWEDAHIWHEYAGVAVEANRELPELEEEIDDWLLANWEYDNDEYRAAGIDPQRDHPYDRKESA